MNGRAHTASSGLFGAALVALALGFFWIGTNPFVSLATATEPTSGSAVGQLLLLGLFFGSLIVLWRRRDIAARLGPSGLLVAVFGWLALTAAIGDDPSAALKRVALLIMGLAIAGAALVSPRDPRSFAKAAAMAMAAMLALAYYGVLFRPQVSIHQATDVTEFMLAGMWRGHFIHKNAAAGAMVIASFLALFIAATWSRVLGWALLAAAVFFLLHTGGKTSSAVLPAIIALVAIMERWPRSRVPLVVGVLFALNVVAVGSAFNPTLRGLVEAVGIDATFTDRASIWHVAMGAILERPLTGYGLQSFWGSDALLYGGGTLETWAVVAHSSHNAYLETLLESGMPGLLLTLVWLVVLPLRDFGRAVDAGNTTPLTRLFARIWLYIVVTAGMESLFYQSGVVPWFALTLAVFGLRLQASPRLATVPQTEGRLAYA